MNQRDRRLRREIVVILIVKLIAITALWWCFIRDQRVAVDVSTTARHLGVSELSAPTPSPQGALNAQ